MQSETFDPAAVVRRDLLRIGGYASLGAMFAPSLAFAQSAGGEAMRNTAQFIERWVGPGKFPGIVASLGLPGQPTQFTMRGSESFTDADAVTPDSLFRIYSMTKPITGMAAMMLIEEGRLGLDQPLADILPKFAGMQVQLTPDGSLTDVRPAKTAITIRHLLTHTAGLGYIIVQRGPLQKAFADQGLGAGRITRLKVPILGMIEGNSVTSLAEFCDRLAALPLVYEPGTRWSYSVGLDVLGRVIEVVAGMPFDQFLKRRIFQPCGMTSTYFQVPARDARRLTTNFGALGANLVPIDPAETSIYLDKPPAPFGGTGLVSSPRDYDRFLAMLASFGRAGRERVMGELAVRVGTGNLLPDGVAGPAMGPAANFGAGGRVGIGADSGQFGWEGAAGTRGWVNMRSGMRSTFFIQYMPPNNSALQSDYQKALQGDVRAMAGPA